jgi:hypothetical protein
MSNNNHYYYSNPQQQMNLSLQKVAEDYHTGDLLKEGTINFILSSVQQKV